MRSNLHSLSPESFRHAANGASDVPNTAQPQNQILRGEAELDQGNSYRNAVVDRVQLVHFDRLGMEFVLIWNVGCGRYCIRNIDRFQRRGSFGTLGIAVGTVDCRAVLPFAASWSETLFASSVVPSV